MTPEEVLKKENIYFGQTNIKNIACSIGYIKKFRWRWFATQLNTFIIIGKTRKPYAFKSNDDYYAKSKRQKTTGRILLGVGIALIGSGFAVAFHQKDGLNQIAALFFISGPGIIFSLGSVPFFIVSAHNKRKTLNRQQDAGFIFLIFIAQLKRIRCTSGVLPTWMKSATLHFLDVVLGRWSTDSIAGISTSCTTAYNEIVQKNKIGMELL